MRRNNVCPASPLTKDKFQRKLAAGWGRIWPKIGKGTMASAMGLDETKTIDRGLTAANLPAAHTVFNSLLADETSLDEVLAHYGFRLTRIFGAAANDLSTAAGTIDAMVALVRSQDDNHRDHTETLAIAELLRPHMSSLVAIVSEADALRGAA
ncbi:hypothetical protein JMG10_13330 [Nostoc ellipsosporum NOK]|nr:hypothetical protein [Nostoc ellipsosporum NOK]